MSSGNSDLKEPAPLTMVNGPSEREEIFRYYQSREYYLGFPPDLPLAEWKRIFKGMINYLDDQANAGKVSWRATAAARKARDVVIATLEDDKIPTLIASLVECEPLFKALHATAQNNLMHGIEPQQALAANSMLSRLDRAIKAIRD